MADRKTLHYPAMRIVHVITRLILGGAQENTLLTCEGLADRGHEVTLITGPTTGPEGQLVDRAMSGGYEVIECPSLVRAIHPLKDWRAYWQLKGLIRRLAPEIVHSHSSKAGILARRAAWAVGGCKTVHTIHGLAFGPEQAAWKNHLVIAAERRAARHTDAFISVADAMTAKALAAGIGRAEQFRTIYSGIDVEPFVTPAEQAPQLRAQLGIAPGEVLVTQVARLAKRKGHEFLLDTAEQLRDQPIVLAFVGDGQKRYAIERAIDKRGLRNVRLTGLLAPDLMPAVMQASDIVVHCSLREGLARALPQAMLAGRPAISFDRDGAREIVTDRTGILVDCGDVAGLAAGIADLANDGPRRAALGQAGRDLCIQRFDHRVMVEQIEHCYRQLLGGD
jgi:glycosyltransferase involved in cell wall biosynthesis